MYSRFAHLLFSLLTLAALSTVAPAGAQDVLHKNSAAMAAKIARIQELGAHPRPAKAEPVRTTFTDAETNAYLQVEGPSFLPTGITDPRVSVGEGGRITASATVDLDAVRVSQPRGLLDPLAFVRGAVEVAATGFIAARNGTATASFESATVAGIPVPRRIAEELLSFYTRTPERPQGFSLDDAFDLPAQIRAINVEAGRATVTQ